MIPENQHFPNFINIVLITAKFIKIWNYTYKNLFKNLLNKINYF